MALYRDCAISRWRYIKVALYRGGVISRWSYIEVALYRGGVTSRWRYIEMALYRGGAVSRWRCIEGVLCRGFTAVKLTYFLEDEMGWPCYEGRYGNTASTLFYVALGIIYYLTHRMATLSSSIRSSVISLSRAFNTVAVQNGRCC